MTQRLGDVVIWRCLIAMLSWQRRDPFNTSLRHSKCGVMTALRSSTGCETDSVWCLYSSLFHVPANSRAGFWRGACLRLKTRRKEGSWFSLALARAWLRTSHDVVFRGPVEQLDGLI
jgi:hypothetical protein